MAFGYNVLHPAEQFRREVDRLLTGVASALGVGSGAAAGNALPVNAWETSDAFVVELEVPGVKSEHVELSVSGNELTMKVDRPGANEADVTYHRRERPVGASTRALRLPVDVDADRVQADLRNGVLTITLPKAEAARPRKIHVAAGR